MNMTYRKDDEPYILRPVSKYTSPLDIEGVDMEISSKDIIQFIQESRKLK
ncbi:MAG: hypothetical protein KIT56_09135 [Gammaproteobacteria bacterium]|nr:hypothetical protein [Gammaproteobacteria bacterium]MCW5584019.1 hypothetical protein [Gammaproteobacteria bacterium]